MPADVKSLDPQLQGDIPSMNVAINVFDMLTGRDKDNKLIPGLATEWKAVDEKTWRFTIREGVKFHNGEPLDTEAVAFSINRLVDPATKSPIVELRYVKSAKAVDAKSVEFQMTAPDPIIPEKLTLFGGVIIPPKYFKEKGADGFAAAPVGTGPFKFVSRTAGREVKLEANPEYWGEKPAAKSVSIQITPNAASSIAAMQAGQLDIVSGVSPDAIAQLGSYPDGKAASTPAVRQYYVAINTLIGGPLAKKEVRQALNHAIDVDALIKSVLHGGATKTATLLPTTVFGYDPAVTAYNFDPDRAESMLAAAGFPNGFDIQLSCSTVDSDITQAVAGQLEKVGARCKVRAVDATQFKALLVGGDPQAMGPMYLSGNTGWTLDGSSFLQSTIKSDRRQSLWHNPQADQLIDIEETSLDTEKRKKAFSDLQQLMKDEAPFLFLYHLKNSYAIRNNIDWTMPVTGVLAMQSAKGK